MQNNKSISVAHQQQLPSPCQPIPSHPIPLSLSTLSTPHNTLHSNAFISLSIALHFRPHIHDMIYDIVCILYISMSACIHIYVPTIRDVRSQMRHLYILALLTNLALR